MEKGFCFAFSHAAKTRLDHPKKLIGKISGRDKELLLAPSLPQGRNSGRGACPNRSPAESVRRRPHFLEWPTSCPRETPKQERTAQSSLPPYCFTGVRARQAASKPGNSPKPAAGLPPRNRSSPQHPSTHTSLASRVLASLIPSFRSPEEEGAAAAALTSRRSPARRLKPGQPKERESPPPRHVLPAQMPDCEPRRGEAARKCPAARAESRSRRAATASPAPKRESR